MIARSKALRVAIWVAFAALVILAGLMATSSAARANADNPRQGDDVCVPKDAWTEQVLVTPASDEIVTDKAAWTETVEHPAITHVVHHAAETHLVQHDAVLSTPERYSWTGNKCDGEPVWPSENWQLDHKKYDGSPVNAILQKGKPGHADYFYWEQHVVTAAWVETVIDKAAYDETVTDTEAWTETITHDAVTHVVHHDAVYTQVDHPAVVCPTPTVTPTPTPTPTPTVTSTPTPTPTPTPSVTPTPTPTPSETPTPVATSEPTPTATAVAELIPPAGPNVPVAELAKTGPGDLLAMAWIALGCLAVGFCLRIESIRKRNGMK